MPEKNINRKKTFDADPDVVLIIQDRITHQNTTMARVVNDAIRKSAQIEKLARMDLTLTLRATPEGQILTLPISLLPELLETDPEIINSFLNPRILT